MLAYMFLLVGGGASASAGLFGSQGTTIMLQLFSDFQFIPKKYLNKYITSVIARKPWKHSSPQHDVGLHNLRTLDCFHIRTREKCTAEKQILQCHSRKRADNLWIHSYCTSGKELTVYEL